MKQDNSLTPEEMIEIAVLQEELNLLKKEQGIVEEKKGFAKYWSLYFDKGDAAPKEEKKSRPLAVVNRKKYLLILLLTGWCGGHQFYAKNYKKGIFYLLFFWTGFPLAMSIADLLIWIPKTPDENGNIEI